MNIIRGILHFVFVFSITVLIGSLFTGDLAVWRWDAGYKFILFVISMLEIVAVGLYLENIPKCNHDYTLESKVTLCWGDDPVGYRRTYKCNKCGKFKKVNE